MSIDVMVVAMAEDIATHPSLEMMEWLYERWEDFALLYGFVEFNEQDVAELRQRFSNDPVGQMLLRKIAASQGLDLPLTIELMISY